jgi:hypothetical protein
MPSRVSTPTSRRVFAVSLDFSFFSRFLSSYPDARAQQIRLTWSRPMVLWPLNQSASWLGTMSAFSARVCLFQPSSPKRVSTSRLKADANAILKSSSIGQKWFVSSRPVAASPQPLSEFSRTFSYPARFSDDPAKGATADGGDQDEPSSRVSPHPTQHPA